MKVLILSHCQLSIDYSIGKTLASLFSEFNKSNLCQLYVHSGLPDIDICESYYRLTDSDVFKGIFTLGGKGTEVVVKEDVSGGSPKKTKKSGRNGKFKELLRDAVWKISPWFSCSLRNWIEKEKPTCIFVAVGSGKFLYDMALKISKSYGIPIISYVCDDFYFNSSDRSLIGKIWSRELKKKSEKLFSSSKALVSICEEMSKLYEKQFHTPAYTVMTGTSLSRRKESDEIIEIKNIRYFGKLTLNRYKSILDIGKILDELNCSLDKEFVLDVYCRNISNDIKKCFNNVRSIKMHGFIRGDEFEKEFFASDALLHVEAFDNNTIERVKYSVSTKIADSLASGIPLFAYGPDGVASIEHLKRNKCAVIATRSEDLKNKLCELFFDRQTVKKTLDNAVIAVEKYHNRKNVSSELYKIVGTIGII